jgi:cytochrome c-type biogenesis protein CcmH/NrfF
MAQMAGEVRWSDPYVQIIIALWAVCFAVSAIGVVLIVVARRRAGAAS